MTTMIDVHIRCSDASHKRDKVCKVAGYIRDEDGTWIRGAVGGDQENGVTWLSDDVPMDLSEKRGKVRSKHGLRCNLCGRNLEVQPENISPILEKLYANGITSVELAHLEGILS